MPGQNIEQRAAITEEQVKTILSLANATKHGSITLLIQDGHLIQIDHSKKIRVSQSKNERS